MLSIQVTMDSGTDQYTKPKVILMDVYETLLDMTDIEQKINSYFDSRRAYTIWFELLLQYCFVSNHTSRFQDFSSIASATLKMASSIFGKSASDNLVADVIEMLRYAPVKQGVPEGLSHLTDHGYRIAALTNSPERTVMDRMEMTGFISYFEMVLSAETIQKYKPAAEVYQWAAGKLDAPVNEMLMVSSHSWDIVGAYNAGMQTAYLKQNRQMLYPLCPQPLYMAKNLIQLAEQITQVELSRRED